MVNRFLIRLPFFATVSTFLLLCLSLLLFFPNGRSFFIFNGMHHFTIDSLMQYLTHIGDGIFALCVGALLLIFYNVGSGIFAILGVALSGLITSILKYFIFIEAPRPKLFFWGNKMIHYVDGVYINIEHSFPSGHSITAFFIFTFLTLLSFGKNAAIQFLFAALAIVAAYSRVYLAQHFVGDITTGAIIGVLLGVFMNIVYNTLKGKSIFRNSIIHFIAR